METVRKINHGNKEILVVDYSGNKVDKMIDILKRAKQLILIEGKPVLALSIFNKNFLTPEFMRRIEVEVKEVEPLIEKNAVIGLSGVQLWILKGMNLWYKRQIHHFDSLDEALEFLVAPAS